MQHIKLGRTGLNIAPVVFGSNIFGWTVNKKQTFEILDALYESGLRTIDTADVYSRWAPGNKGGESETLIGDWLKLHPGKRSSMVLLTKVGMDMGGTKHQGLSASWIREAAEHSLNRLRTDYIDLYQAHQPDATVPQEQTLRAFEGLLKAGKVRAIGASNFTATQLEESLAVATQRHLPAYHVLQPEFNLFDHDKFPADLQQLVQDRHIAVITYYSLASGFLSGKYRSDTDLAKSKRGAGIQKYLVPRGLAILDALDAVATAHHAKPAEVALAWLMAHPAVTAPIASATSTNQIKSLLNAIDLTLTADELAQLSNAAATV